MTRDHPYDEAITSTSAFGEALTRLLLAAHRNDVAVEGGWECRNGGAVPDWEAVIYEVEKRDAGDGNR